MPQTTSSPTKRQGAGSATLATLAGRINESHRAVQVAITEGLQHAKAAGEVLIAVKAKCPHGAWGDWVDKHFQGSARTAQRYMTIAKRWPELEAKATRVSDLPYREAVRLLAVTSKPAASTREDTSRRPKPLADWSPERRRETFTKFWDAFASCVLAYDAAGSSVEQIADLTNMPATDVESVLYPQGPRHPELESNNERFCRLCEKAVLFVVESKLAMECDAATYVAENEHLPHGVVTLLEAASAKHHRRAKDLSLTAVSLYLLIKSLCGEKSADATMMRVIADSRSALGIRATTEDSFFLWLLESVKQAKIIPSAVRDRVDPSGVADLASKHRIAVVVATETSADEIVETLRWIADGVERGEYDLDRNEQQGETHLARLPE